MRNCCKFQPQKSLRIASRPLGFRFSLSRRRRDPHCRSPDLRTAACSLFVWGVLSPVQPRPQRAAGLRQRGPGRPNVIENHQDRIRPHVQNCSSAEKRAGDIAAALADRKRNLAGAVTPRQEPLNRKAARASCAAGEHERVINAARDPTPGRHGHGHEHDARRVDRAQFDLGTQREPEFASEAFTERAKATELQLADGTCQHALVRAESDKSVPRGAFPAAADAGGGVGERVKLERAAGCAAAGAVVSRFVASPVRGADVPGRRGAAEEVGFDDFEETPNALRRDRRSRYFKFTGKLVGGLLGNDIQVNGVGRVREQVACALGEWLGGRGELGRIRRPKELVGLGLHGQNLTERTGKQGMCPMGPIGTHRTSLS